MPRKERTSYFGKELKKLREDRGYSEIKDLEAEMSQTSLGRYELGTRQPTGEFICALVRCLRLTDKEKLALMKETSAIEKIQLKDQSNSQKEAVNCLAKYFELKNMPFESALFSAMAEETGELEGLLYQGTELGVISLTQGDNVEIKVTSTSPDHDVIQAALLLIGLGPKHGKGGRGTQSAVAS
jgi:transcriptional regulator with XRE-family HTH domain